MSLHPVVSPSSPRHVYAVGSPHPYNYAFIYLCLALVTDKASSAISLWHVGQFCKQTIGIHASSTPSQALAWTLAIRIWRSQDLRTSALAPCIDYVLRFRCACSCGPSLLWNNAQQTRDICSPECACMYISYFYSLFFIDCICPISIVARACSYIFHDRIRRGYFEHSLVVSLSRASPTYLQRNQHRRQSNDDGVDKSRSFFICSYGLRLRCIKAFTPQRIPLHLSSCHSWPATALTLPLCRK